jgi:hypothetical protein
VPDTARDDRTTVIAIGVLAACTAAVAHEAFGHGVTCMLTGGHIALLNNAFFRCAPGSAVVSAAGPAGNLLVGFGAFAVQPQIPARYAALRLYLLLVMAFCLYWEAGYLFLASVRGYGDYVFAWQGVFGAPSEAVRAIGAVLGIILYGAFGRMLRRRLDAFLTAPGRMTALLRPAWLASVVTMAAAAALYAPDRLGAMRDAALSIIASFPLLFAAADMLPETDVVPTLARRPAVIVAAIVVFVAFAATMGRGIR